MALRRIPRSGGLISDEGLRQAEQIYGGMALDPPNPRAPVGSLSASKAISASCGRLARSPGRRPDEPTASARPDALHLFEVAVAARL